MLFNSLTFILFLPAVVVLYFALPHKFRWLLLLAASIVFYGWWNPAYLWLLALSTTIDFSAARVMTSYTVPSVRRTALGLSLVSNLALLAYFKYSYWLCTDVFGGWHALESATPWLPTVLPVGISFYTFQTMSYSIDVYRHAAVAERNPLKFGLFVGFFPQLVAGPIERFSALRPQLFARHRLRWSHLRAGGQSILVGLFVKMCVADNLAPTVNAAFSDVAARSSAELVAGAVGFGLQIFSDFYGYSLIAVGSARCLGIHLMTNFKSPYTATSIRSFWQRWHISLSTWFRDYVYAPLGGSRHGTGRALLAVWAVFLLSGLWHGANYTFLVWGALHAAAYSVERLAPAKLKLWLPKPASWMVTMLIVFAGWVFFRAASVDQATHYLHTLATSQISGFNLPYEPLVIAFAGLTMLADHHAASIGYPRWFASLAPPARWAVYAFLIYNIAAHSGTIQHPFIYFQF